MNESIFFFHHSISLVQIEMLSALVLAWESLIHNTLINKEAEFLFKITIPIFNKKHSICPLDPMKTEACRNTRALEEQKHKSKIQYICRQYHQWTCSQIQRVVTCFWMVQHYIIVSYINLILFYCLQLGNLQP